MATATGKVTGPAWAGIEDAIVDAAFKLGLKIVITNKTGLLQRHYYFTLTGPEDDIKIFMDAMQRAVEKANT